jgi:hypothetical protein
LTKLLNVRYNFTELILSLNRLKYSEDGEQLTMKTKEIRSLDEYIEYTDEFKGKNYFRGQANSLWNITPYISRTSLSLSVSDEQDAIAKSIEEDRNQHRLVRIPKQLEALFKLQHYGTPTRICDLTISNLCALFFAVSSDNNDDGAVYIIDLFGN